MWAKYAIFHFSSKKFNFIYSIFWRINLHSWKCFVLVLCSLIVMHNSYCITNHELFIVHAQCQYFVGLKNCVAFRCSHFAVAKIDLNLDMVVDVLCLQIDLFLERCYQTLAMDRIWHFSYWYSAIVHCSMIWDLTLMDCYHIIADTSLNWR